MATEEAVNDAKQKIEAGLAFREKSILSRTEWGSLAFEGASVDVDRIFTILGQLDILPLKNLPDQAMAQIRSQLQHVVVTFSKIDEFKIEVGNSTEVHDGLLKEVHQRADELYTHTTPYIPYLAYERGDVETNIKASTDSVKEAEKLIEETKEHIEAKSNEISEIITAAREASAVAGAAVFTEDFEKEATARGKKAVGWLWATGMLAVVTLASATLMFFYADTGLDLGQLIQKSASRLVVLGILLTGTLWCGRLYKTQLHQASINRHRALSLKTFQAFSRAASDDTTKDAVLLEATRAVFGNVPTGFLDKRDTSSPGGFQIIEVAKRMATEE